MRKRIQYIGIILATVLFSVVIPRYCFAQIGGNANPLQLSTHDYSVAMDKYTNAYFWDIYSISATEAGIIDHIDAPFIKGTAYTSVSEYKTQADVRAHIEIRFNGTLAVNTDYQLVYREESGENCDSYRFFTFRLEPQFDVDIDLTYNSDLARCPDASGVLFQNVPATITDTTLYDVFLVNPDYLVNGGLGNWSFDFLVSTGIGANAAIIDSLVVYVDGAPVYNYEPNSTSFHNTVIVSTSSKTVVFKVYYVHVWGVDQLINFELSNIAGAFEEQDADASNMISSTIYDVPAAGAIQPLN